jgi:hypothetical protein
MQEELKQKDLDFIRKRNSKGHLYFVANLGDEFYADSIELSVDYRYVSITDPQTSKSGYIETDDHFYLNVPPGKSFLIQTSMTEPNLDEWQFYQSLQEVHIEGPWKVTFENKDVYNLKDEYHPKRLSSWTDWRDKGLKTFKGKAKYQSTFELDESLIGDKHFTLNIEEVRETARVIINGMNCGTIWSFPNQLEIPKGILQKENTIEIVVQNLSSNYMKKYDEEHPEWKKFYDINFVNITYEPFTTSKWDYEPSGIIGEIFLSIAEK